MDEQQWFAAEEPGSLLAELAGAVSSRTLRLFGCACLRRVWHRFTRPATRRAVELIEADESWPSDERLRQTVLADCDDASDTVEGQAARTVARLCALGDYVAGAQTVAYGAAWLAASIAETLDCWGHEGTAWANLASEEALAQTDLLREIVGNPVRPVAVPTEWLTAHDGVVVSLARTIYDERAFERLPILGDALEDAGCADALILDHCRGANGHVRGCWLLDLILGLR